MTFFLKPWLANGFTGKLSDFAGLFAFPFFWAALVPRWRVAIYLGTAVAFTIWKLPVLLLRSTRPRQVLGRRWQTRRGALEKGSTVAGRSVGIPFAVSWLCAVAAGVRDPPSRATSREATPCESRREPYLPF